MTESDWKRITHFNVKENWGDSTKIAFQLVWFLDCYRDYINQKFIISCGTQGVHKSQWHEKGLAIDGVIDRSRRGALNCIFAAMRFPFTGLGVYPKARYKDFRHPIGFHFDIREINDMPRGVCQAQWIGVPDSNGENQYYALTEGALKRWDVI